MTKIIGTLRHARTGTRRWTAMGASAACLAAALTALPAQAQSDTDAAAEDASDNDIIVTATKRGDGERLQDVPIAITAFAKDELDRSEFRGLESIGNVAPNVQLNPIGTVKGTANFTIRGLGTNSSIPSLDPTAHDLGDLLANAVDCNALGQSIADALGFGGAAIYAGACTLGLDAAANAIYDQITGIDSSALEFDMSGVSATVDADGDYDVDRLENGVWTGTLGYSGTTAPLANATYNGTKVEVPQ